MKRYLPPGPYTRDSVGLVLLPVLIALVMLLVDQFGLQTRFMQRFGSALLEQGVDSNHIRFLAQVYFSSFTLICFVGLPLLFHVLFPPALDNPFGFRIRSCRPHIPLYAMLLVFMVPLLWLASSRAGFFLFYPMYKPVSIHMWLAYEAIYMVQFFAVEFFFRGFALFRLEPRFGYHAITIMVVPYALLHIHKPFSEALASIVAGLVLGLLALKSRSIWPGVVVHCTVAFSMDWFSLIHSGLMAVLLR